jgi:hypothetical protein
MSTPIRKVSFEMVSGIKYPGYYRGERPVVRPEDVPNEHWHTVSREGEGVEDQYDGLLELIAEGELIRNARLLQAAEPQWREVGAS